MRTRFVMKEGRKCFRITECMQSEARVLLATPCLTPGHFGHTCANFVVYMKIASYSQRTNICSQTLSHLKTDIFRFRTLKGDDACGSRSRQGREPLHMSRAVLLRQRTPATPIFNLLAVCSLRGSDVIKKIRAATALVQGYRCISPLPAIAGEVEQNKKKAKGESRKNKYQ